FEVPRRQCICSERRNCNELHPTPGPRPAPPAVERGLPIVGGGAGTGISAKCEEAGGIDLIVIYNSGRYRMAGRGSLAGLMPYGNANQIVKEMGFEVLTAVQHTPVLAGVCATDPFMLRDHFL